MQSTGDIAAFRIGRCVPNKLKEREALPSNLRLQEPSYLGNEQSDKRFEYPAEQLEELIQILNLPNELEVTSDFLKLFKIYSVVVTQYNLTQETHTNRQSIQIQLLSDEPYIIKIKEEDK